jgi:hypothetical protein
MQNKGPWPHDGASSERFSRPDKHEHWMPYRFLRTASRLLPALVALSGCALFEPETRPPETIQWRSIPLSAAWTTQPDATYAVARDLGPSVDQKLGLANETVMAGENVLLMRGYRRDDALLLMPRLDDFLTIAKGHLAPFSERVEGMLVQSVDAAGVYNWAETAGPEHETCVLAMRRLRREEALIPTGFTALDIVLRNCVHGGRAAAMAPFGPERVAAANLGARPEGVEALSHLAGPRLAPAPAASGSTPGGRP